ncbi:MAG: 23S rRNA (uracil(1939)-C(5))-methyltransferase RlmD [Ruminococcus sp.]|nr:23S rRNA (uracil(1939)-C(5))-methyltransferase RlmD [Ruminococcus sp.]
MLKKNDIITLEITGMTNEGNGVGRHDGMAVFVPMTAVGDVIECKIVKVLKSFCYGIIDSIITPSSCRIQDNCPVYSKCGGCSFRHFTYEEELRIKEDFVRSAFERIGKIEAECEHILGSDRVEHYRNKAQYPVAQQDGKAVCGFYSRRSHRVTGTFDCALQPTVFTEILVSIMDYINAHNIPAYNEQTGQGLVRHIYLRRGEHTGEIMVCIIVTDIAKSSCLDNLACELAESFPDIKSIVLNENSKNTNVIMGSKLKTIFGKDTITDIMCGNKIILSPQSFYQVNTMQAEMLYAIAKDYAGLTDSDLLLDLYCGAGTIGLSMSDNVKSIIGVEIIPSAIENAKRNAQENGIANSEFICGDAGKIAEVLYNRGEKPDVIIADPARKGCDIATLEYMVKMNPERIVMISCNPATAARDCNILEQMGYKVEKYRPVDLFPRTTHVETVALITRAGL